MIHLRLSRVPPPLPFKEKPKDRAAKVTPVNLVKTIFERSYAKHIAMRRFFFHSKSENRFYKQLNYYFWLLEMRFAIFSPLKCLKCCKAEVIQCHPSKLVFFYLL